MFGTAADDRGSAPVEELDAVAGTARVGVAARLVRAARDPASETVWEVRVDGDVGRDPRLGWQLLRTSHATVRGRRP
jgi:hypothetical protein